MSTYQLDHNLLCYELIEIIRNNISDKCSIDIFFKDSLKFDETVGIT